MLRRMNPQKNNSAFMVNQIPHLYPPPFETELVSSTNFREMADRSGSLSEATPQRPRWHCHDLSAFDQRIPNSFETIHVINHETSGAIRTFDIIKNGHKWNSSQSRFHFSTFLSKCLSAYCMCIWKWYINMYIYLYTKSIYIYISSLSLYIKSFSLFVFPFPA